MTIHRKSPRMKVLCLTYRVRVTLGLEWERIVQTHTPRHSLWYFWIKCFLVQKRPYYPLPHLVGCITKLIGHYSLDMDIFVVLVWLCNSTVKHTLSLYSKDLSIRIALHGGTFDLTMTLINATKWNVYPCKILLW